MFNNIACSGLYGVDVSHIARDRDGIDITCPYLNSTRPKGLRFNLYLSLGIQYLIYIYIRMLNRIFKMSISIQILSDATR